MDKFLKSLNTYTWDDVPDYYDDLDDLYDLSLEDVERLEKLWDSEDFDD